MAQAKQGDVTEQLAEATAQRGGLLDQELWRRLKLLGLVAAGTGVGVRGAQGLYGLGKRTLGSPPRSAYTPTVIDVPVPTKPEEEKQAGLAEFFQGGNASRLATHPLAIPTSLAVGAGGLYGGWKLMDYLLDKKQKSDLEAEKNKARQEYEEAVLSPKSALARDLDRLCDAAEKRGWNLFGDTGGLATGLGLTAMGGTGLLAGVIAHHIARKRQESAVTRKALQRHQRAVQQLRGAPIYARPVPVPADEEEPDQQPV